MLTDQDIDKLLAVLATKQDVEALKTEVSSLKESVLGLTTAVDGLAKVVDDLRIEYAAVTSQLNRHEQWIRQIAEKVGVALEIK